MHIGPQKTLCFIEYLKKFNSYNFKLYFKIEDLEGIELGKPCQLFK